MKKKGAYEDQGFERAISVADFHGRSHQESRKLSSSFREEGPVAGPHLAEGQPGQGTRPW